MEKRWDFAPREEALEATLARDLRVSPVTARLLVARGLRDPASAATFLRPTLDTLHDPMTLDGMPAAVERLRKAVRDGEKIGIWGDYDVDGTTGTAILQKFFSLLDVSTICRVPHRVTDGYGLHSGAIERFAEDGVKVLITIDCGTSNRTEIELAASRGIDVIVVDHHEPPETLPPALAIVNPKLAHSRYPFRGLCSAGLSFKLAWALSEGMQRSARLRGDFREFLVDAMGYVALGTVADVSPLLGENRVFVKYGLDALRACRSPGLRALVERARLDDRPIDTEAISFRLAPRLNALGRVGSAMDCVELLTSSDPARIEAILTLLEASNRARKDIEDGIFEQARAKLGDDPVTVVSDPRWHIGVVGIVAARLVDESGRPAFVLAEDGELTKGSGRSVEGFPLHEAIAACRDLLLAGGGHARAAGVTLRTENVPAFRERLISHARERVARKDLVPVLRVDDEVPLTAMSRGVVLEIGLLAPHGEGNPPPLFVASHLRVAGTPRLMGRKNAHLSFHVSQNGGAAVRAVLFNGGAHGDRVAKARTLSLAFTPQINAWGGREEVELLVHDVRFV